MRVRWFGALGTVSEVALSNDHAHLLSLNTFLLDILLAYVLLVLSRETLVLTFLLSRVRVRFLICGVGGARSFSLGHSSRVALW